MKSFFQQVKVVQQSNPKEIRLFLADAKKIALTLGQVNSRLLGDMERFLADNTAKAQNEVVQVEMDGGGSQRLMEVPNTLKTDIYKVKVTQHEQPKRFLVDNVESEYPDKGSNSPFCNVYSDYFRQALLPQIGGSFCFI